MNDQLPVVRHWHGEIDADRVLWLAIDKQDSGTNVLSREVMTGLAALLDAARKMAPAGIVIHSAKPSGFVAGADINEFPSIGSEQQARELSRQGQRVFALLDELPCSSVAVLGGAALGGGLELAMATTWRLGLPMDQPCLGLPEVQLGLHPGFGGTVRGVRLLGVRKGMELQLTGRPIRMSEGLSLGLIDAMSSPDRWRADAARFARRPKPARNPALLDRLLSLTPVRNRVAASLVAQARRKAKPEHYPAPFAMIDLWRRHAAAGDAAFEAEAASFGRMAVTPPSRNLVRVFFLQDRLKKRAGKAAEPARHVHVVGAGVMGGDIASWCALQGLTVTLQDRELKYIEPALARAAKLFAKRLPSPEAQEAARTRVTADVDGAGAAQADVVIEAIFENLEAKRELFTRLEKRLRPGCILATNTSSIPLEDIATALDDPSRLVGLHFFNPVAKLPLVEVVRARATADGALQAALAFARQIGKLPLPCRSHPGFLVNRILAPYMGEAMTLAQEGVPLAEIDLAATDFGMPMGPVELADSVGLDIAMHVARILAPVLGRPVAPEIEALVQRGHLGVKSGQGFYVYQEGRPVKPKGSPRRARPEVQERLVMSLLNEAAHCLADGIVDDADLVDAGVIFGTGFAPFRGGPMQYARSEGIDRIVAALSKLAARHGSRFAPSAGWEKLRAM